MQCEGNRSFHRYIMGFSCGLPKDLDGLVFILKQGVDVNQVLVNQQCALQILARCDHPSHRLYLKVLDALARAKANIQVRDAEGRSLALLRIHYLNQQQLEAVTSIFSTGDEASEKSDVFLQFLLNVGFNPSDMMQDLFLHAHHNVFNRLVSQSIKGVDFLFHGRHRHSFCDIRTDRWGNDCLMQCLKMPDLHQKYGSLSSRVAMVVRSSQCQSMPIVNHAGNTYLHLAFDRADVYYDTKLQSIFSSLCLVKNKQDKYPTDLLCEHVKQGGLRAMRTLLTLHDVFYLTGLPIASSESCQFTLYDLIGQHFKDERVMFQYVFDALCHHMQSPRSHMFHASRLIALWDNLLVMRYQSEYKHRVCFVVSFVMQLQECLKKIDHPVDFCRKIDFAFLTPMKANGWISVKRYDDLLVQAMDRHMPCRLALVRDIVKRLWCRFFDVKPHVSSSSFVLWVDMLSAFNRGDRAEKEQVISRWHCYFSGHTQEAYSIYQVFLRYFIHTSSDLKRWGLMGLQSTVARYHGDWLKQMPVSWVLCRSMQFLPEKLGQYLSFPCLCKLTLLRQSLPSAVWAPDLMGAYPRRAQGFQRYEGDVSSRGEQVGLS